MSAENNPSVKTARWAMWLPLGLFLAFVALAMSGIFKPADRNVASKLIGKPLPSFALKPAVANLPDLSTADLASGRPALLNVFASWCVPCAAEAPQLSQLKAAGVQIHGIAIRDRAEDVATFLVRHGNPYARIGADDVSAVQLALGSSGVPETFVIDGKGVIRYQHIGEIRPNDVPILLAKLQEAGQ